ncbi:IMPACT family protein [Salinarchaeum laminariae]|uniref:IMPACT family protein n=1 Tax=Salinarchaeum laminariae TaxID=869888 RepID=UPI0020C06E82|nr:YigZ family protein [Salinarchaeum laminariae]
MTATDPYSTVAERASAAFEVQGSEFIGYVAPVESETAAEAFTDEIAAEYDDATHVVPAYRVRTEDGYLREYSNDDGEPSGSAGKPALNVLQGQELENVAVAIVRYYGGTNLGVGGLVSAYGRSTADAIEAAGVVEREPHEQFTVTVEYDDSGSVRSVLEGGPGSFDAAYEERVQFVVSVPSVEAEALRDRLRSTTSGRATIE